MTAETLYSPLPSLLGSHLNASPYLLFHTGWTQQLDPTRPDWSAETAIFQQKKLGEDYGLCHTILCSISTVAIKSCHKYCNYSVLQSGTNAVFCRHCRQISFVMKNFWLIWHFSPEKFYHAGQSVLRESIHIWEMEKHQFIMKLFTGWTSLGVEWSTKWQLIDDFIAFLSSSFNISRL